ncbi:uncharacterized protein DSM5745_04918 [Aspergillus mulundensis]|uniref:BZIP domain-containing protein n=1 Tax=Aspergillus mulundensis TaxID=1810919 RepID=A0A3D8S5L8_9EURO|nr:Uncharacterized protein DSM5745_04918 [Aspergillus mulundensis]RDW81361.1 Uncharacterized protein DSM5745_04918 [Aspergillus mulundensis]
MSKIPAVSGPSPTDAYSLERRGSLERKRRHADEDDSSPTTERRDSLRSRPLPWHPSAPVEPPYSSQHRSIGVTSILNPSATEGAGTRTASVDGGREGLGERLSLDPPSHARFSPSSMHLPSPSMHSPNLPLLPSGMRSHQGVSPVSPSARFPGATGYFPPKPAPGQTPLAQQLPRLHTVAPSSPLPMIETGHPTPLSAHHHQLPTHLTSTFASHRASTNHTPTPSSKEPSPTTPVSVLSPLGRSSPALAAGPGQPAPGYMNIAPYAQRDPTTGVVIEAGNVAPPGKIVCFVDLKSGSAAQAEKRRANSGASRRFRNRKREDQQKIAELEEEKRKLSQELRMTVEQRDFYRSERDYFRDEASRFAQLPVRPTSPPLLCPKASARADVKAEKAATDASSHQRTSGPIAPAPMPALTWTAPSSYSTGQPERTALDKQQARPIPRTPGAWSRTT